MRSSQFRHFLMTITSACGLGVLGCGRANPAPPAIVLIQPSSYTQEIHDPQWHIINLSEATQRLGTAIMILIDTSRSMEWTVADHAGEAHPKSQIAGDVLRKIIQVTEDWQKKHTDSPLFLGINSFSSTTAEVLKIGPFDAASASESISRIPSPAGFTAIGDALEEGFRTLYSTGCVRKHLVCITDGGNTVGTSPDLIARQLYLKTDGDVRMHFVAFNTSAEHFDFLKETGGSVVEATDGPQLQSRLIEIYEKQIFAEAMPAEKQ